MIHMRTTCPNCRKNYETELDAKPRNKRTKPIQNLFPDAEPYQLEQCITGICSDKCYDQYLGIQGYTYDEKGRRFLGTERMLYPQPP